MGYVRSRWLDIDQVLFFAFLWTETESRSIKNLQIKNEANNARNAISLRKHLDGKKKNSVLTLIAKM